MENSFKNEMSPSNSSPQNSEKVVKEKVKKKYKSQRGRRIPRKQDPQNQHEFCLCELTEIETECTGPPWVCIRSSRYILWLSV